MTYYMKEDDEPVLYFSDDGCLLFKCPDEYGSARFDSFICNNHNLMKVSKKRAEEMLQFLENL